MDIQGYGGRAGNANNDLSVIQGVRTDEREDYIAPKPMPERHCSNKKCRRLYTPRAEGDDYCSEVCDLDDNQQFKPSRNTPRMGSARLEYTGRSQRKQTT